MSIENIGCLVRFSDVEIFRLLQGEIWSYGNSYSLIHYTKTINEIFIKYPLQQNTLWGYEQILYGDIKKYYPDL